MLATERHFSINQLCELWFGPRNTLTRNGKKATCHQNYHTVRRWFLDRKGDPKPGVMNFGNGKNICLQVPESIAFAEYEHRTKRRGRAA